MNATHFRVVRVSLCILLRRIRVFSSWVFSGGGGAGGSADGRLNALINMLNQANYLINIDDYEAACDQLGATLKRCDDFVQGTAQNDLKQMISELMNDLGC